MLCSAQGGYPRQRQITRHRNRLGLLYPGSNPTAQNGKSAKSVAATKPAKPTAANPGIAPRPLPKDWQAIDIGQLVLAKADGPWSSWWEAVPVETIDDGFKLRWRDGVNKSLITRSRFDLALIRPDAA
jgi:hypothetical protein